MTVFLPLAAGMPLPASPSFLSASTNSQTQISKVIKSILKAKRIVVICGAGISVDAGIPDFRSSEGLFKTLKRDNPREVLASGKDLFDASVFNSEHTTTLFCQMISQLWGLSQAAEPTAFHNLLRALDERGKLLRVYTQNIDAIEEKCGLSFGVPEFEDKRCKGGRVKAPSQPAESTCRIKERSLSDMNKVPGPSTEAPRCIPLHGTLKTLHCQICNHSFPLEDYLHFLAAGLPPTCPECTSMEETRQLIGKRARGIGKLRPSVVLYNEAHKDGEGVGDVVQKDLIGSSKGKGRSGADLLLVVGTSLRVPGTKRMVREFAKAVRSRGTGSTNVTSGPSSPAPSPRRSPSSDEEPAIKAVYLNLDFPVPTREWEGVFDTWIQGDAQVFAEMLHREITKETRAKEVAAEKKRKREEEASTSAETKVHDQRRPEIPQKKRKADTSPTPTPKRRKVALPPTPPKTPSPTIPTPKLYLRIPARSKRTYLVPEVYITTPAPSSSALRKSGFGMGQPPMTPEESPPPRFGLGTKSERKAARAARAARAAHSVPKVATVTPRLPEVLSPGSPLSSFDDEDEDDDNADLLPDSFVRTVQYGLRGSEG
ncbi:NAD-dependent protein deacetylase hst4 [Hypsizygus marmoreus]|uniref:NAD-dependent protein deacetylase hst4 n=1 Tax=Hypsizygus marmoreus TaxID=39966 RepID=A0A369JWH1_HYPMA|nr:NAD-dependent protein deacetylase hst4 [Hypsizygus marmoreus]